MSTIERDKARCDRISAVKQLVEFLGRGMMRLEDDVKDSIELAYLGNTKYDDSFIAFHFVIL